MERRRLGVLCSHLCSPGRQSTPGTTMPLLSPSGCHADGSSGFGVGAAKESCVFCLIVHGMSHAFKLYEDDVCLCILDSNPLSPGHSLIIPKLHFPSLEVTPPSVVAAMCSTIPFLSNAIMKAAKCDSFNLLVNNGAAAGQMISHAHLHIIPRRVGDQLWPSEGFKRQAIKGDEETFSLVSCIRDVISTLPKFNCSTNESQLHKYLHD
ncbi:bis(5'-adenosyl)-triphosphatase [Apostasia shenzhenica]|uniref:Bis(5'-adenosyl)-triphosphatase n=1 Tax=Apostasia shenzhenica TaxID=1088818 RepID=A0A2I0AL42_9ASPA|nr:bis(5'-adenosyl)-triphosphatase [Apostasia shenzhenica]